MIHKFNVAPMMDWTDRHDRYFLRLISRHVRLYTEMLTSGAILYGNQEKLLAYDASEHPVAIQLGGSDPAELATAAKIAAAWGYDEINLNVGCPSDRVQSGRFGACLMAEPELVAECMTAIMEAVTIPVTIKTRIGIDNRDSYEEFVQFIHANAEAGCRTFIIHARKAWLHGLSPKENRELPPLHYDRVYQLKRDFPELTIVINGGITDLQQVDDHLKQVDGVMLGRAAYQNPYLLAEVDRRFFADNRTPLSRHQVIEALLPYVEDQLRQGVYLSTMTRHILGLFQGLPGARAWRRYLSKNAHRRGAGVEVLEAALKKVPNVNRPGLLLPVPCENC